MPQIIKEVLVILLGSTAVAFTFNYYSENPLPLIRLPKVEKVAPDSLLFSENHTSTFETDSLEISSMDTSSMEVGETQEKTQPKSEQLPVSDDKVEVAMQSTLEKSQEKISEESPALSQSNGQHESDAHGDDAYVVTFEQVQRLENNPDILFIDARQEPEFSAGHIGKAINIYTPEFENNLGKVLGLPRDKRIIVYCGGGACELSHELADNLRVFGFTKVFVYTGGWTEWTEKKGL